MIGEVLGDVVPDVRSLGNFRSFFERRERFFSFVCVEVSLAESDLEARILGREDAGLIQFGNGFGIFMLLEKQRTEGGMGDRVERIQLNLLFIRSFGFVKFFLLLQSNTQVVVGVFVKRVYADLLAKCVSGFIEIARAEIGETEIVPSLLVLRFEFDDALKEWNSRSKVAGIERGETSLEH